MQLDVIDQNNKKIRSIDLGKGVEDEKVNKAVLYFAIKAQRNNLRHGTVRTKTRGEVNRTNKKLYRQKGTGNARHGPRSANIFVGGGNVFGPLPRSYFEHLNKKMKKVSYREALRYLALNSQLKLVDKLDFAKPSTKSAAKLMQGIGFKKALVVLPQSDENSQKSFRNLKDVKVINECNLSIYDLFRYENVVMTGVFFEQLRERYSL